MSGGSFRPRRVEALVSHHACPPHAASDDWMSLAVASLAHAYGHSEPEYSAEDLVP